MEKPVSVLPAPAPMIVTSPKRSVENVSAFVAPITPAVSYTHLTLPTKA